MTESTIEPATIAVAYVKNGTATLRCHWNVRFVEITVPMPRSVWRYDEAIIKWALPISYNGYDITAETLPQYLSAIESEIMSYAKATKLNF